MFNRGFQTVEIEFVQVGVSFGGPAELAALTRADAELMNAAVANQIVAAADDAGVRQTDAQILVAKVGVGVEMDDVHVGVHLQNFAESAQSDKVLAANH